MADRIRPEIDALLYDELQRQDGLLDETIDAFKENWFIRETNGVFDPSKPPRVDLSENVRNVLACWWAPIPITIVNRSHSFSPDLSAFADKPDIDFVPSLSISVAFSIDEKIATFHDLRIGNSVGDRKFYLFTRTRELPEILDEIYVLRLAQSVNGKDYPFVVTGTLEPLSRTITSANSSFVVVDMLAKGYKPYPFDYVRSIKLTTGADNYWPSDISVRGAYDNNGILTERNVPFKVADTLPLNYEITQIRNNQAEVSFIASHDNIMLKPTKIKELFSNLGASVPLVNGFKLHGSLSNLLFTTIMISRMVKVGFKNVREFATQSDKDNNIQTWAFFIRSQLENKSATDIGNFIGNIISEARYHIDNNDGTYDATFDKDNPRGVFGANTGATLPTEDEWNQLYAILAMGGESIFSKYSFGYGQNALPKMLLPFYLDFDLTGYDVTEAIEASNNGRIYSAGGINLKGVFQAALKSAYLTSSTAPSRYSVSGDEENFKDIFVDLGYPAFPLNIGMGLGLGNKFDYFGSTANVWQDNNQSEIFQSAFVKAIDSDLISNLDPDGSLSVKISVVFNKANRTSSTFDYIINSKNFPVLNDLARALNSRDYTLLANTDGFKITTYASIDWVRQENRGTAPYKAGIIIRTLIEINANFSYSNPNNPYSIINKFALQSSANVINLADQSVTFPVIPETLAEQQLYSLASLYPDNSTGNWVWIKAQPGRNAIDLIDPYVSQNYSASNYAFNLNNATEFDLDIERQDPNGIKNLKEVRRITSNNIFGTNITLEFVLASPGNANRKIVIGNLGGKQFTADRLVLGDPSDHTIGFTEIAL